ncbi:MAG: hypothetical protein HW410_1780 [Nitrosarchaeum sp.]|nr:hypothetical protein [Nitrosarchaeum sp.]
MTIKIKPTAIKQSIYLLVPKNIAEFIDIGKNTTLLLSIENNQKKCVLRYEFSKS